MHKKIALSLLILFTLQHSVQIQSAGAIQPQGVQQQEAVSEAAAPEASASSSPDPNQLNPDIKSSFGDSDDDWGGELMIAGIAIVIGIVVGLGIKWLIEESQKAEKQKQVSRPHFLPGLRDQKALQALGIKQGDSWPGIG